jgi:SAM-dependent methyltransferase
MIRRTLSVLALVVCSAASAQPKLDVPFGPTSFALVNAMLRVADLRADDYLVDLGSGDGRINIIAARERGVRGIGFELDPELVRQSRHWARLARVDDKVRFVEEDLFGADLSQASVVAIYLGPIVTPRVRAKLLAELQPGTRIVSHNFEFGGWKPDLVVRPRDIGATIYFWWAPARVAGGWRGRLELPGGSREYAIDLRQEFQEIDGEARGEGLEVSFRDARLEGTRISFLLMERHGQAFSFRRFIGEVRGDAMEGHFRIESDELRTEQPFRLTRTGSAEPGPPGAWTWRR